MSIDRNGSIASKHRGQSCCMAYTKPEPSKGPHGSRSAGEVSKVDHQESRTICWVQPAPSQDGARAHGAPAGCQSQHVLQSRRQAQRHFPKKKRSRRSSSNESAGGVAPSMCIRRSKRKASLYPFRRSNGRLTDAISERREVLEAPHDFTERPEAAYCGAW